MPIFGPTVMKITYNIPLDYRNNKAKKFFEKIEKQKSFIIQVS